MRAFSSRGLRERVEGGAFIEDNARSHHKTLLSTHHSPRMGERERNENIRARTSKCSFVAQHQSRNTQTEGKNNRIFSSKPPPSPAAKPALTAAPAKLSSLCITYNLHRLRTL